ERARRVRFDILSGFRGHDSGRLYHSIVLPAHPSGNLPPRPVLDAACLDAACQRALGPEGLGLTAPLPSAPPRGSPGAPEIRERAAGRDVAGAPDDGAGGMRPRAARIEARDGERVREAIGEPEPVVDVVNVPVPDAETLLDGERVE